MIVFESISIAIDSIRLNKLRAFLTLLSICIGVFAIIVAITLVKSINNTVTTQMADLGENTFSIYRMPKIQFGAHTWRKYAGRKRINYSQVQDFKRNLMLASSVSAMSTSSNHTLKTSMFETNPDVSLIGTDASYFETNNILISDGRAFIDDDITFNRNVTIIGNDIVQLLFPNTDPIGKDLIIGKQIYSVIGIIETKGAILGRSQDNIAIIPITQFLKYYSTRWEESLTINVKSTSRDMLMPTIDEAIGILRGIRDDQPWELNSFELETNETIALQFAGLTGYLSLFGFITGFIALFAAGIGIMNIMLVTIKERTREIGIRKAVGAKKRWIMSQFIIETITLCQLGGALGIVLGLSLSFLFGNLLGLTLVVPFDWILYSLIICTILGLIFGAYPAWKAANLDPIEALRYE
jgi:putative ABC transport system permease protein